MKHTKFAIVSLLSLLSLAASAIAGERHFANVYETTTAAKGEFEFENWVTWKTRRGEGDNSNLWKFRHEIEYGITDRLQLGVPISRTGRSRATRRTATPRATRARRRNSSIA